MALGKTAALFVDHKFAVKPLRVLITQSAIQQNLACGRFKQVGAADHLGDVHCGIVGDTSQLIARSSVPSPNEEIAEVHSGDESLRTEVKINKFNGFSVRHAKTPVAVAGLVIRIGREVEHAFSRPRGAAGSGIDGLIIEVLGAPGPLMRGANGRGEILAGAAAGIDESACAKLFPCSQIHLCSPALLVGSEGTAYIGPFVPIESQPAKIFEGGSSVFGAAAVGIEIFHAHHEAATGRSRSLPCTMEGACVSDMEITGGRWGEAAPVFVGIHDNLSVGAEL